jgi:hypothetical protein
MEINMTQMNLYIRKHTFSNQYGPEYFFNFFNLLEKDISDNLANILVNFFEKSNNFRSAVGESIHPRHGNTMVVYKDPAINYGFTVVAFVDHEFYRNFFLSMEERLQALDATDILYQLLGWSISPTRRVITNVGDFNLETQKYENFDFTFNEIESMYNSSTDLTDE